MDIFSRCTIGVLRNMLEKQANVIANTDKLLAEAIKERDAYKAKLNAGTLPKHEWNPHKQLADKETAVVQAKSNCVEAKQSYEVIMDGIFRKKIQLVAIEREKEEARRKRAAEYEREKEEARRIAEKTRLEAAARKKEFEDEVRKCRGLNIDDIRCSDNKAKITLSNGSVLSAWISDDRQCTEKFGLAIYVAGNIMDYPDVNKMRYGGKIRSISIADKSTSDYYDISSRQSMIIRTTKRTYEFCLYNEHNCYYWHDYKFSLDDKTLSGKM